MWWTLKNGVKSGPFTRDKIETKLRLGMLGPLDRISEDGGAWQYVRETEFWKQERTIPEPVAMPASNATLKAKISLAERRMNRAQGRQPTHTLSPVLVDSEFTSPTDALGETPSQKDEFQIEGLPTTVFSIWKLIFGGVFQRHRDTAVSSILNGDGHRALPEGFYPKAWLWSRVWLWATILTGVMLLLSFGNPRIIPGFIMLAAFGVPVAMVLLFLECDITRRVSVWKAAGVFIIGGVFSLFATTILNVTAIGASLNGALGAGSAGPIEETAKLLILLPFLANSKRYPSVLNGMVLGASVGAGFAAFETAGYVFNDAFMAALVNGYGLEDALGESIVLAIIRAIFSPFCHIAWTASIGGALWRARGQFGRLIDAFSKLSTWGVILLAMLLHLLWNWGLGGLSLVGVAPWVIIAHYLAHGYGTPNLAGQDYARQQVTSVKSGISTGAVIAISITAAIIGALAVLGIAVALSPGEDTTEGVGETEREQGETLPGSGEETPSPKGNSFSAVQDKLVIINCGGGTGSGFLAKMDGKVYLVSNEHVIRGTESPKATLLNGETLTLGDFSVATDRDLARFEVLGARDGLSISSKQPTSQDFCAIYGNSGGYGVATDLKGKIIGVGPKFLETDIEFIGGNSGSPALNESGEVVGAADALFNGKANSERDWSVKDTQFDAVRRFAVRLTNNVNWKPLNRREYERQVNHFEVFKLFFNGYLWDYLAFDKVGNGKVSPSFNELDAKNFNKDEFGFAECMQNVRKTFDRRARISEEYFGLTDELASRIEVCKRDGGSEADVNRLISNFVDGNDMEAKWEKTKDVSKAFLQQLKRALLLGRSFLENSNWDAPQLRKGHTVDSDFADEGIEYWLNCIAWILDDLEQRERDLDKNIRKFEGNNDED